MVNIAAFDLNLLKVLAAVLEHRSLSRAATAIGLSQPATSNALGRLRLALKDPLLVRRGHVMYPTPLAESLLPQVRRALDDIAAALNPEAGFDPARQARRFRILANDYAATTVLLKLLAQVSAWPVSFEILPFEDRFEERLNQADYDLAIRDDWAMRTWAWRETIGEDELTGICRVDHPRIGAAPSLDQFLAERHVLISPTGASVGMVDAWLRDRGLTRHIDTYLPQFAAAPALIAGSDRVMCLARSIAEHFAPAYAIRTFALPLPPQRFHLAMAWHPRAANDPAGLWLRDRVKAAAG
ncbi:hypothetical protein ABAC460_05620 [Asticcacaulis sp. AC460]|uniref:LysR family transcriptional regulator n=1 Tax=Asticcacaulis sp. AC460 TaxID=1282360 RepID=UPI0003C3D538|nr:LysR family transcriptional regulator [Asticcacaulis sp. AC460]ESQ91461.1 hypothetical protein ABAC460_05620 [Asticcacaulis sp. AC460]